MDSPLPLDKHAAEATALIAKIGTGGVAEWPCPVCKTLVDVRKHGRRCSKPDCLGRLARQPEDAEAQRRFRRELRLRPLVQAWGTVPVRFQWARFGPTLTARVTPAEVARQAETVLEQLLAGGSLLLSGPSGSGKTSIACAVVRSIVDAAIDVAGERSPGPAYRLAAGARFVTAFNLAKAGIYTPLGQMPPLVRRALKATVLVIDDLGTDVEVYRQSATSVREVLHERHAERRPTIVTTYLKRADIAQHYGAGIERRFAEGAVLLLGAQVK